MTESIQGPGLLFVRSRIEQSAKDILDEESFLRWYDDEHIPEVVSTSGIRSGFRYVDIAKTSPLGSPSNSKPFLAFYPMNDLAFTLSEEFKRIAVKSENLPGSGIVYDMADFDISYLGFVGKTDRRNEDTRPAKYILSHGTRPDPSRSLDWFFAQQTEHISRAQGYVRSLSFRLQYARTNAQSRKLKGLPSTDESSPEPSTWLTIHEFEEKPGDMIVDGIKAKLNELEGKIGSVKGEVFVWRLERVHGEGKMF